MTTMVSSPHVKAHTRHGIHLPLTPNSQVKVQPRQRVEPGTPLAVIPGTVRRLRLPAPVQGSPNFRKQVGEAVTANETLVVSQSHFGLGLVEYLSPLDGVIEAVEERFLLIRAQDEIITAHFVAEVEWVEDGHSIGLRAPGDVIFAFAASGGTACGPLALLGSLYHPTEVHAAVTPALVDHVVAATTEVSASTLQALAHAGVRGVIVPGLSWSEWSRFAANGSGLTIVVTEPLGTPILPAPLASHLEHYQGTPVYLDDGSHGKGPPHIFFPHTQPGTKTDVTGTRFWRVVRGPGAGTWVKPGPGLEPDGQFPSEQGDAAAWVQTLAGERIRMALCNLEAVTGPVPGVPQPAPLGAEAMTGKGEDDDQE